MESGKSAEEVKTAKGFKLLTLLVFGSAIYLLFEPSLLYLVATTALLVAKLLVTIGMIVLVLHWGFALTVDWSARRKNDAILRGVGIILLIGLCLGSCAQDMESGTLTLVNKRHKKFDRTWDLHNETSDPNARYDDDGVLVQ